MTKYRIYEIAKELNLDNKKVLAFWPTTRSR